MRRARRVPPTVTIIVYMVTSILVTVVDEDAGEVDRLTRSLRTELLALDVDGVELVHGTAPEGAKADAALITELVVALAGSPVLIQLGRVLRDWVNRANGRKLVVRDGDRSIEITGYDLKEVEDFFSGRNEGTEPTRLPERST